MKLVDAQEMARLYPDTFEAPDLGDVSSLAEALRIPGHEVFVKVCFEKAGERMWVLVNGVSSNGDILGTLANSPVKVRGVGYGAVMTVRPEEVYDFLVQEA